MRNVNGNLSISPKAPPPDTDVAGIAAALFKAATLQGKAEPKPPASGSHVPSVDQRMIVPPSLPQPHNGPTAPGSNVGGPDQSDAPNNETGETTPPPTSEVTDTYVNDWLDSLGDAISPDERAQLAQVGDDTTTLLAFFRAYPEGSHELNDNVPPAVAAAEGRLLDIASVKQQLVDPDSGKVTRFTVSAFLTSLDNAANAAKDTWGTFKDTNGSADAVATRKATDASILQANLPVLDTAGGAGAQVDGKFNLDDLKAAATTGGLPAALSHAAASYADQGEFSALSSAGLDPSKTSDGLVSNDTLKSYLSADAGTSVTDTLAGLRAAALQDVSEGGDPSKVTADYFKDPSKSTATGADKLAAIVQLEKTVARYNAGESAYVDSTQTPNALKTPGDYHETYGDGPTPGEQRDDFIKQVKDRIDTLSKDSDVASLVNDKMPGALQAIVASDPALKADLQTQFDDASNTDSLQLDFKQTDDKGNPVSTTDALSTFVSNANEFAQALGITPDYSKALAEAPQDIKDKVKQGYDGIISGKEIDDLTKSGTPQGDALIQAAADKTVYDSVLDKQTVQDGTDKFGDLTAKLGRDQLTDGKSGDDLLKGLGIDGENDPKLQQLIKDNLGGLTPAGQDQASASDVLRVVRSMVDSMRSGMKFDDAVAKVRKETGGSNSTFFTGSASDAYKSGAIHAASAILLAGGLAARISGGQSSTPATVQQCISVAGLLTEGGGKTYASIADSWKKAVDGNLKALVIAKADAALPFADPGAEDRVQQAQDAYDKSKATLDKISTNLGKDIEAVGKSVGGVAGNALGFVFGITGAVQAAKAGDIGGAAAQGIFAGLNGISTVATTAEVASYVIPRVAPLVGISLASDAPGLAALAGGIAGSIGAAAGGIAAVGGIIYGIVASIQADDKKAASEQDWYTQLQDGFAPSGLPVPDLGTLISAPNGYVYEDGTSPPAY